MVKLSRNHWFVVVTFAVIILDQLTKLIIKNTLILHGSKAIIPKILSFTYIANTGASFGILRDMNTLLIIVSIIIIGALLYYIYKNGKKEKLPLLSFALVVGGATGNLIDRIAYGSVIDFINFHFWPAFNVADSAITIGVIAIIYHYYGRKA